MAVLVPAEVVSWWSTRTSALSISLVKGMIFQTRPSFSPTPWFLLTLGVTGPAPLWGILFTELQFPPLRVSLYSDTPFFFTERSPTGFPDISIQDVIACRDSPAELCHRVVRTLPLSPLDSLAGARTFSPPPFPSVLISPPLPNRCPYLSFRRQTSLRRPLLLRNLGSNRRDKIWALETPFPLSAS